MNILLAFTRRDLRNGSKGGLSWWGNTWDARVGLETHLCPSMTTVRIIISAAKNASTARFPFINQHWFNKDHSSSEIIRNRKSMCFTIQPGGRLTKYWVKWALDPACEQVSRTKNVWWIACEWWMRGWLLAADSFYICATIRMVCAVDPLTVCAVCASDPLTQQTAPFTKWSQPASWWGIDGLWTD